MNHLGNLISRNLNQMEVIRPRLASRFEPLHQDSRPSFRDATRLVQEEVGEKRRPARDPTSNVRDASFWNRFSGPDFAFQMQEASGQSTSRRPERSGIIQESSQSNKSLQPEVDSRSPISTMVERVAKLSDKDQADDDRTSRLLRSSFANPLTFSSAVPYPARHQKSGQRRSEKGIDQETADEARTEERAFLETHGPGKENDVEAYRKTTGPGIRGVEATEAKSESSLNARVAAIQSDQEKADESGTEERAFLENHGPGKENDEGVYRKTMGPGIREGETIEAKSEPRLHSREVAAIQSDQEPDHSLLDHGLRISVEASVGSIETKELESEGIPPQKENATRHSSQDGKIRGQKKDIHHKVEDKSDLFESEQPRISPNTVVARPIIKSYLPPKKIEEKTTSLEREPDVLVTIGRIEVKAIPLATVSQRKQERSQVISLEDYLKDKRGGL